MDILTYIIIFVFFTFLAVISMYFVYTFILQKKIEEISKMIDAGQAKLAIRKLNEILEKDDKNSYAHYLMAKAYMNQNNAKYAIVEYRRVLKLGRFDDRYKEIDVRSTIAKLYMDRNILQDAKKEYLILTKIQPDNFENYLQLENDIF